MCAEKNSDLDELTQSLLKKCEANNLPQFYINCVERLDHVASVNKIASLHKSFSENKIAQDIADIPELIIISIPELVIMGKYGKKFATEKYVVDAEGLGRVVNTLKRKHVLRKSTLISEVRDKLGIALTQDQKLSPILSRAIEIPIIYAKIEIGTASNSATGPYLTFYNKLKHPNHKKDVYKLIVTIVAGIIVISILLPIVAWINA